jgi:hypothetical protein
MPDIIGLKADKIRGSTLEDNGQFQFPFVSI